MPRENILDILQPEIRFGIEYHHLLVSEYIYDYRFIVLC